MEDCRSEARSAAPEPHPKNISTCHRPRSLFGTKVVPPQPILKALPKLVEVKDDKARAKIKELVVELSR